MRKHRGRGDAAAVDAYLGRVSGVLVALTGVVPAEMLARAQHLIDHGEPAEGLLDLAWSISNGGHHVPRTAIDDIRTLTADLVPAEFLPPDLDDHIG